MSARTPKLVEDMRRIVAAGPTDDLIANMFIAYMKHPEVSGVPMMMRYTTPKPWLTIAPEP